MVLVININTLGDFAKAERILNRVKKRLPVMTREGMRRWGKILEKDMKKSAHIADIQGSGEDKSIYNKGIEYRQGTNSDIGNLFITQTGVLVDSMKPHYVNIHKRRLRLMKWARRARSTDIRRIASRIDGGYKKPIPLYVTPHPYINRGFQMARPKLKRTLKRQVQSALRK